MRRGLVRSSIAVIAVGIPSLVAGQSEDFSHHPTLSFGAGFTTITGPSSGTLHHGGNIQLNGGYFFTRHLGVTGNFMLSNLGITRATLDDLNEPDGKARVYAVTADPTVRLPLGRGFSAYALAGGGYIRRTVTFTMPIAVGTYRHKWHVGTATKDMVVGRIIDNSSGFDVGGGLNMPSPWGRAKVFVEARYFRGFTTNQATTVIPFTFGIRW